MDNIASTPQQCEKYKNIPSPASPPKTRHCNRKRQLPRNRKQPLKPLSSSSGLGNKLKQQNKIRKLGQQDHSLPSRFTPTRSTLPQSPTPLEIPLLQPKTLDGLKMQNILDKKPASLGPNQKKVIYRWMWQYNTTTAKGYEIEFQSLLASLGFCNTAFSPELKELLRTKAYEQIRHNGIELRRRGAVTTALDEKKKKVAQFAEWTEGWMSKSWDGSPQPPSWRQLFFSPYFGESHRRAHKKLPVVIDRDTDSHLEPEILVVEKTGASGSNNPELDRPSITSDESQELNKMMLETCNIYCNSIGITSGPNYEVDVSQLLRYQGVQLTPNDAHRPVQTSPTFVGMYADL